MGDVVGFGALNLDLIYEVESLEPLRAWGIEVQPGGEAPAPQEALQPVLEWLGRAGVLRARSGGGSAANTVLALARMGFETGLVGKVGSDPEGDFLLQALAPVDTSRIRREGCSGLCLVLLNHQGERTNLVFPGSNDSLSRQEIDFDYLRGFRFLHLTSFVGPKPFAAQVETVREVSPGVRVGFDPGEIYARLGLLALRPILTHSFVLFLTEAELSLLTGKGFREGCGELLASGPQVVVCKRGAAGSYLRWGEGELALPARPVGARDATGAGDVFAAGFLAGLLLGRPLPDCARIAGELAASSTTGYGREKYPDRKRLEELLSCV